MCEQYKHGKMCTDGIINVHKAIHIDAIIFSRKFVSKRVRRLQKHMHSQSLSDQRCRISWAFLRYGHLPAFRRALRSLPAQTYTGLRDDPMESSEIIRGVDAGTRSEVTIVLENWTTQYIDAAHAAGLRVAGTVSKATKSEKCARVLPTNGKLYKSSRISQVIGRGKLVSHSGTIFLLDGPADTASWNINRANIELLMQQGSDEECRTAKELYIELMNPFTKKGLQRSDWPLEAHTLWGRIEASFKKWHCVANQQGTRESSERISGRSCRTGTFQEVPKKLGPDGRNNELKRERGGVDEERIIANTSDSESYCKESESK